MKQGQKVFLRIVSFSLGALLCGQVIAIPLTNQCSSGEAIEGISTADVNGNAGGSTDCFGAFDGSDPADTENLTYGGMSWSFVSKVEVEEENDPRRLRSASVSLITEGEDIGLDLAFDSDELLSGTWSFDSDLFSASSFIIVLKAANDPGWAAYLFDGRDAASNRGEWRVAWGQALSHVSIYAKQVDVPEPTSLLLLGSVLMLSGFMLRRLPNRR